MGDTGQQLTLGQRFVGVAEEVYRRIFRVISTLGLPPSFVVQLEVAGRRSAKVRSTILITAQHDGQRFLVSVLGNDADWVRNARAAGGEAYIVHGGRSKVRLAEVPVEQRAPIIRAYLQRARGARAHIDVPHDAPVEEFARIAERHPVFRIEADG